MRCTPVIPLTESHGPAMSLFFLFFLILFFSLISSVADTHLQEIHNYNRHFTIQGVIKGVYSITIC